LTHNLVKCKLLLSLKHKRKLLLFCQTIKVHKVSQELQAQQDRQDQLVLPVQQEQLVPQVILDQLEPQDLQVQLELLE
jgi:hypothetical protein